MLLTVRVLLQIGHERVDHNRLAQGFLNSCGEAWDHVAELHSCSLLSLLQASYASDWPGWLHCSTLRARNSTYKSHMYIC